MASTYLTRTQGSGNRKIFTQSFWCKVCDTSGTQSLAGAFDDSNNYSYCFFDGGNLKLQWKSGGSVIATLDTNRKFRDPNAWYHIVYAVDTTQSTSADRIKLYVNGVQETSFSTATYPNQNASAEINGNGITYNIGSASSGQNFNGVMSHLHFCDGTALAPTVFGETDSTTGEWKINTSPSFTPGTNGFTILKDGNTITDQSSNSNDFSLGGGTLTNTEDCPSNVFCTLNPLDNYWCNGTFAYGNTRITTDTTKFGYNTGTLGASSGKWYWEMKLAQAVTSGDYHVVGVASVHPFDQEGLGYRAGGYAYQGEQGNKRINGSQTSYGSAWSTNDIIGIAMDLDNKKLYFSKNNVWQNSGVPTSGSTGTGAISLTQDGFYFPAVSDHAGGLYSAGIFDFNFGNGYFGTTAVASAGTNASGNGIFEYDTPTGYTALSTKGLNE